MNIRLFITAFVQVFFVAINTVFLSRGYLAGAMVVLFIISIVWTFNVTRIAFGGIKDKLSYAFGATFGTCAGLLTSKIFI